MTDFMCEPVDLDDWIKEVDSSHQPKSFSQRVPPVKAASKLCLHSYAIHVFMQSTMCHAVIQVFMQSFMCS